MIVKPDPRQMQFWNDAQGDLFSSLSKIIGETYYAGVADGVDDLGVNASLVDFNLVNAAALKFAKDYNYKWIKGITDTTREQTMTAITNWMQSGAPLDDLSIALEPIFGEVRARMIAATETTRVYAQGNMDAWDASGVVDRARWMTAEDDLVCEICGSLDGVEFDAGDTDHAPPAHVNCRCSIQPIVSMELVNAQFAKIAAESTE